MNRKQSFCLVSGSLVLHVLCILFCCLQMVCSHVAVSVHGVSLLGVSLLDHTIIHVQWVDSVHCSSLFPAAHADR